MNFLATVPFLTQICIKMLCVFFFCIVAVHICQLIMDNNLDEPLQSAYKVNHSTETAFKIKVQNDILRAIDDGNSVISLL